MSDNVVSFPKPAPDPNAVPEFIIPRTIAEMSDAEISVLLDQIRTRRLAAGKRYAEAEQAKAALRATGDKMKLNKKMITVQKQMERVDQAVDKLELMINQMRALQLQLED
jgi:hypothetical protein